MNEHRALTEWRFALVDFRTNVATTSGLAPVKIEIAIEIHPGTTPTDIFIVSQINRRTNEPFSRPEVSFAGLWTPILAPETNLKKYV